MTRFSLEEEMEGLAKLASALKWSMCSSLKDESNEEWHRRFLRHLDLIEEQVLRIRGEVASELPVVSPPAPAPFTSIDDQELPF